MDQDGKPFDITSKQVFDAAKTELLREIYHTIHSQFRRDSQSLKHWFRILRHRSALATVDLLVHQLFRRL